MMQRRDSGPPLKDRVYTTLYRLRYGWQFRSSVAITGNSPIWILGKCYLGDANSVDTSMEGAPPHVMDFMEHYHSLPWMTYRANFSNIRGTNLSTDCGWGCMVRSGQMILATALHRHLLKKEWRLTRSTGKDMSMHKQILSWFADLESDHCPFSLHCLMTVAKQHGYRPGDWFGPSQVAILIRDCVKHSRTSQPLLKKLQAYVACDCTVYVNDVMDLFEEDDSSGLILLVPVRLGSEALNPIYIPCVKSLLALDQCVGIIGGKPKHSVYFVGFQDDKLVHLDPHYCQTATEVLYGKDFDESVLKTYHCSAPRKLTATKMDPSCTIGFYCRSRQEFCELRQEAEKRLAPPLQKGVYPFFTFIDQHVNDAFTHSLEQHLHSLSGYGATMTVQDPNASLLKGRKSSGKDIDDFIIEDDDDFVIVKVKGVTGTGIGTEIGTRHSGSEDEEETGYFMKEAELVDKPESFNLKKVVREGEFEENGEMMLDGVENNGGVSLGVESEMMLQEAENDGGMSLGVESEMMLQEAENDGGVSLGLESQPEEVCVSRWVESKVTISQQMSEGNEVVQKVNAAEYGHFSLEQADHQNDDLT